MPSDELPNPLKVRNGDLIASEPKDAIAQECRLVVLLAVCRESLARSVSAATPYTPLQFNQRLACQVAEISPPPPRLAEFELCF